MEVNPMIITAGSINNYLKQQRMQFLAKNRLKDYTPASKDEKTAQWVNDLKNMEISGRINAITSKLKAGKKLTGAEMAFIREHAPALYDTARKLAIEREEYRRKLDKAKTKDEADRTHMQKLQEISMEAKQGGSDPETMMMRINGINDEHGSYMADGNYAFLKREHEIDLEKHKEKKAAEKELAEKLAKEELAKAEEAARKEADKAKAAEEAADNEEAAAEREVAATEDAAVPEMAAANGAADIKPPAAGQPDEALRSGKTSMPDALADAASASGPAPTSASASASAPAAASNSVADANETARAQLPSAGVFAAAKAPPPKATPQAASTVTAPTAYLSPTTRPMPSGTSGPATRRKAITNYAITTRQGEAVATGARIKKKPLR
jgi:hypothetical protein